MLRRSHKREDRAQVFVEYLMIIGIVVMVLFAMSMFVKRGLQGMIKSAADEIGYQRNADQVFGDSGHLESQYTSTRVAGDKTTQELMGVVNYVYADAVTTNTTSVVNLGFTEMDD